MAINLVELRQLPELSEYELQSVIGSGGFGIVIAAYQRSLARRVAIKILPSMPDETVLQRFKREGKILCGLNHPNLVKVYAGGVAGSMPYLVTEFLQGVNLEKWLGTAGPYSAEQFKDIFVQVSSGLQQLHGAGVIHRDITTANIMIMQENGKLIAKVIDLGLAYYQWRSTEQRLTKEGTVGTPEFMSPEQCFGKDVDERSDIYSLGCVMYRVLTGRLPFTADDANDLLNLQASVPPPPIKPNFAHEVAYARIIERCLEKEPHNRFENMSMLREALIAAYANPDCPLPSPTVESAMLRAGKLVVRTMTVSPYSLPLAAVMLLIPLAFLVIIVHQQDNQIARLLQAIEAIKELPHAFDHTREAVTLENDLARRYAGLGKIEQANQAYDAALTDLIKEPPLGRQRFDGWQSFGKKMVADWSRLPSPSSSVEARREEVRGLFSDAIVSTGINAGSYRTVHFCRPLMEDADNAVRCLGRCATLTGSSQVKRELAKSLFNQAVVYFDSQEYERSLKVAEQASEISAEANSPGLHGASVLEQSVCLLGLHRRKDAEAKLDQGQVLLLSENCMGEDGIFGLNVLSNIALMYFNNSEVAFRASDRAYKLARQMPSITEQVKILIERSCLYRMVKQPGLSQQAVKKAYDLTREISSVDDYAAGAAAVAKELYEQSQH